MKKLVPMVVVAALLFSSAAFAEKVDPVGGWDQVWSFDTDATLVPGVPATLAGGASVSLNKAGASVAEISGGTYKFYDSDTTGVMSTFNWAGSNFDEDAAWTFDIKFRIPAGNTALRYNFFGYIRMPGAGKDMTWNFDHGSTGDGLYYRQHDTTWSTKISNETSGWHVLRVAHDVSAAFVRLWLDDVDAAFRNNAYTVMVDYGYDGFAIGAQSSGIKKNFEIDFIRFADEYVPGAPTGVKPADCAELRTQGYGIAADLNEDCYVNLEDLGVFVNNWLLCNDPTDQDCQ